MDNPCSTFAHDDGSIESPSDLCARARALWLSEAAVSDPMGTMPTVEQLYRTVWLLSQSSADTAATIAASLETAKCGEGNLVVGGTAHDESTGIDATRVIKRARLDDNGDHPVFDKDDNEAVRCCAGERLALILLQSARTAEADEILASLGYPCRLAARIFRYHDRCSNEMVAAATNANDADATTMARENTTTNLMDAPCRVVDNFLTRSELEMLQGVFLDPTNDYWISHQYKVEPPSPYFSYLIPLSTATTTTPSAPTGNHGIARLVRRLQDYWTALFPVLQQASYCEMWAHNRPHATGHQFHFDSDNEGCTNVIRNPICSVIVYLTNGTVGGPSIVTTQRLASRNLSTVRGGMCKALCGRMMAFDGKLLHGVIPGMALPSIGTTASVGTSRPENLDGAHHRRVSVMFAFWRSIRVRNEPGPGAARPFPTTTTTTTTTTDIPLWARQLQQPLDGGNSETTLPTPTIVQPMELTHIYESTADAKPWTSRQGMLDYEDIFQGF
jgi:hypothetical protein